MNTSKMLMSVLITAAIFITNSVQAQDVKGTNYVNLGVGIGTFGFTGTGGIPIVASIEHQFTDKISGGVSGGFIKRKFESDLTYSYVVFGAKGAYHFNEELNIADPKIDVYGGAALYYRSYKIKYKDHEDSEFDQKSTGGTLGVGIFAGGRYLFAKNAGAFAEVGYGISPLQLGLTFKF
jgi:hypothetical protein